MKKFLIQALIGIPITIAIYILLEFIYCSWITHSPFELKAIDFIMPVTVWLVVQITTMAVSKKNTKK